MKTSGRKLLLMMPQPKASDISSNFMVHGLQSDKVITIMSNDYNNYITMDFKVSYPSFHLEVESDN